MTAQPPTSNDEQFASLFLAGEAALVSGQTADLSQATSAMQERLQEDLACVRLLQQALRRAPPAVPEASLELPWKQLGRFELRRELGRGGMGIVYLAYDSVLGRDVALKVPRLEAAVTPQLRQRFQQEARAAAGLEHPNIVPVYESGQVGPVCFLVSAYCPGTTLAQWLKERSEPVPFRLAAALMAVLSEAIAHAHGRGVIHRDLKPPNVILAPLPHPPEGEAAGLDALGFVPRVTDFGLAKLLEEEAGGGQTQSGAIVGTPCYMAPEQAGGKSKEVGPAADIYALGAILYELLMGRPPFRGETDLDTLLQVTSREAPAPRELRPRTPRDLETICLKCLEKPPQRRYNSAAALADDLRRFLKDEPIKVRPVGRLARRWRWCRRNPALAGLTAALALLLVAAAAAGTLAALHFAFLADQAQRLQTAAENQAEQSRRRLVEQYVANGERFAEEEDFYSALAWFSEALDLDRGNAEREQSHRIAIHSLLRRVPQLLDLWVFPESANPGHAASPDGRRLLAVNDAGLARIWDIDAQQPLTPPLDQAGSVRFAAFSPDGRLVLTANADHAARVWNAETGRPVSPVLALGSSVRDAVPSADGGHVVTLTEDGQARLWDGETGQALPGMDKQAGKVRHVGLSPDGRLAVSAGDDRTVRLWDSATGQPALPPLEHPYSVWHASFSPDGRRLVTACHDWLKGGEVRVWSCDTGDLLRSSPRSGSYRVYLSPDGKQDLTDAGSTLVLGIATGIRQPIVLPHKSFAALASFSRDGARLLTAGHDMTARLWGAPTGWPLTSPVRHGAPIWHASFSADGSKWRTVSQDGVVRTWAATGGGGPSRMMKHNGSLRLALSPDGRSAATAGRDNTARVWDLDTGRELARLRHRAVVRQPAWSADGQRVGTISDDGTARVWDVRTGQPISAELRHGLQGGTAESWLAFSPDGHYLVTAGWKLSGKLIQGEAQVWDVGTGQLTGPPLVHAQVVNTAQFSPDGQRLLTASGGGAFVWDLAKRAVLFELGRVRQGGNLAAYSPDGARVLTANLDGTARLWDARTGRPVTPPLPHATIWHAAFSPDGRRVLTTGEDQFVRLWDAASGKPLTRPLRHRSRVMEANFSADGRFVVTGSHEGARVWDAATGRLLTPAVLAGRGSGWGRAALTPDNRRVVTTDHDEFVRVWDDVLFAGTETTEDLVLRARLVAGQGVDAGGGLVPLEPVSLRSAWDTIQKRTAP